MPVGLIQSVEGIYRAHTHIHTHTLLFLFLWKILTNTASKSMTNLTVINCHDEHKTRSRKREGWYFSCGGQDPLSEEVAFQLTQSGRATAMQKTQGDGWAKALWWAGSWRAEGTERKPVWLEGSMVGKGGRMQGIRDS